VCKNLIRVFFLRDTAKKRTLEGWFEGGAGGPQLTASAEANSRGRRVKNYTPRRIAVVGAGVMGSGIAQWIAAHGLHVVLRDVSPELVDRGYAVVRELFDQSVERGKLTAGEANAALHRITPTTAWDGFADCDLVIEAIVENTDAKRQLFSELATIVREDAVLASNTSALPIEEIAGHVPNPGRTVGIHFFNPVSRMPLVELIVGSETSAETGERALALVKALGKSPVICRSSPGFLVTRVLFFYLNEAVRLWEQGVPTGNIDRAMREWGWPMGPLRLIDEVGVDVTSFIFDELAHYFPERFTKSRACAQLVAAGLRGRKAGASAGFYAFADGEQPNPRAQEVVGLRGIFEMRDEPIQERLMGCMVGEGHRCLQEDVVKSRDDIDFALLSGAGFPAWRGGLMEWASANRFAGS
jgi:3-hydroxyacyl-CoA dehydrogenase/enoyl-CoA hydratase/3-hydroxybutyryl-CoA epimerase